MSKRILLSILLTAVVSSCESVDPKFVKDGVNYAATQGVFRGRWWSYYERGVNLMRGGFHDEAAADFREALKGRSRDAWQARTYGLHFVEYFPNRELAAALVQSNQLDEAQLYLERSLASVDTARAHYYLDVVKREQIARGTLSDSSAPTLTTSLQDGMIIADRVLPIQISATDDSGVYRTSVNGRELYQRGSAEDLSFEDELLFVEGTHEVSVVVSDLADKETKETVHITVDLTGPTVGIRSPKDALVTQASEISLTGSTVDKNGVVSIQVDGRTIAQSQGDRRLEFNTVLPLTGGENTFILVARDRAGNETHTAIKVYKGNRQARSAKLWLLGQKAPELLQVASASPSALSLVLASVEAAEEDKPVRIELKSPKEDRPWRNDRAVRVSGTVTSKTGIARLLINGEPFEDLTGEPKESFNKRIPLDDEARRTGTATIEIAVQADDNSGNQDKQEFKVLIEPIVLRQRESFMPVAVLAFGPTEVASELRSELRTVTEAMVIDTGRFNVLERERLAEILTEQDLSASLGDPAQALQLGRVIPAQAFLIGNVTQHGDEAVIWVNVNSNETSRILFRADAMIEDINSADSVREGCARLAEEVSRGFPRISGEIMTLRNTTMLLNWTEEDGVLEGMHLWVVHQTEPWIDEDTGEILEEGEIIKIGEAAISKVTRKATTAQEVEREGSVELEKGMATITM